MRSRTKRKDDFHPASLRWFAIPSSARPAAVRFASSRRSFTWRIAGVILSLWFAAAATLYAVQPEAPASSQALPTNERQSTSPSPPGDGAADNRDDSKSQSSKSNGEPLQLDSPASGRGEPDVRRAEPYKPLPFPLQQLAGPRQLLDLFGIDRSQRQALMDGRPLVLDEEESLVRILYRMPQFPLEEVHRWQRTDFDWNELETEPQKHRASIYHFAGKVRGVARQKLLPEMASRVDFDHYYRVQIQPEGTERTVLLCARTVPQPWHVASAAGQHVSAWGLFLKSGGEEEPLVFATDRVAWHPEQLAPELGVDQGHVMLARWGMDVGLFEQARRTNKQPLGGEDRECFYQLLAAVSRSSSQQPWLDAAKGFQLAPLLSPPATARLQRLSQSGVAPPGSLHGQLMSPRAVARRVTRVDVEDADIRRRFGIDHYYQIDAFLPLENEVIRLGSEPGDTGGPVYTNSFPATFCVLHLPDGLDESQLLEQTIQLPGVYYKLWSYRSPFVKAYGRDQKQLAPMFVGYAPQLITAAPLGSRRWSWIGGITLSILLGVVCVCIWWFGRRDARFESEVLGRQFELREGQSLDDLDLP